MKRLTPLLLLALCAAPAWGQPPIAPAARRAPTVTLAGPDKARPGGRMVIVQAFADPRSFPNDLIAIKYKWAVLVDGRSDSTFLEWPDGSRIVIATSESDSTTTVILDVDCAFGTEQPADGEGPKRYADVETVSPELLIRTIAVVAPKPEPRPDPDPDPGPTPGPEPRPLPTPDPLPPPVTGPLWVGLVSDVDDPSMEMGLVRASATIRAKLESMNAMWFSRDDNAPDSFTRSAIKYVAERKPPIPLPFVVVVDRLGIVVKAVPAPKTEAEIVGLVDKLRRP